MLTLLGEALQDVDSMIEHCLILPLISSLHDPGELISKEMIKLTQTQSRVFIVLQSSLEMEIHVFKEASKVGLVDKESVWMIPESIANLLDSVNKSAISYMEGALGIKTYYSERSREYKEFKAQFQRTFWSKNPEEDNRYPGFYALQAYDSINIVTQAFNRMTSRNNSSPKFLLSEIQSSNFIGLSGHIQLEAGQVMQKNLVLRIVNVAGKSYKELCFWTEQHGFTTINHAGQGGNKYVKVEYGQNGKPDKYSGFCIDIFEHVLNHLGYGLPRPYRYYPINGTYNDMVQLVYNKTYDAFVGDTAIIEERLRYVDFTLPYAESGLSMIVPLKTEDSAWMFMKPFTWELWLGTGAILIYTMCVVWYLERVPNPEFHGNWKLQLSTALWFTFSSLFFAHRENMHSSLTRVVMVSWLFLVLILTSSYTASLSSMLTFKQLRADVTDIQRLKDNNKKVGCDGDSFVRTFLEKVKKFKPENIISVYEYKYDDAFANNSIAAAFLEIPYEKVFIDEYCKKYTGSTPSIRFGGLGFVSDDTV
ncbi:putative periplasmic binding protein-like I [Medicago truncatula]|uniref:Putative periplasmic binding protein-like I n=1 Tax=Medicago truncatula TaxID=3880 RepID=A0A396JA38_MEDTR|nr:putative periplasmic binding protein-like I [Medicago truncatula]